MAKYIGRKISLGIARETSRGTYVTPAYYVPKTDFDFADNSEKAVLVSDVGTIEESEEALFVEKWGEGTLTTEVRLTSFGLFLYSLFGTDTPSGPSDSAYTHAFTLQDDAQHDSLSFTIKDPNNTIRHSLVMLSSLTLKQTLENPLVVTATFMGRAGKGAAAVTPDYNDEVKFVKRHMSFKIASSIAGLSGASSLSLKSFEMTINANVVRDSVTGTAEPEDFLNRQFSVSGKVTMNNEDDTYKELMLNNTHRAIEIAWTNTDEVIGAATRPSLKFQLPNVDFYEWKPNRALNEIVTQDFSFRAHRDVANDQSMVHLAQIVNAVASY